MEKVVSYYSNLSCKFRNLSNFLFFTIPVKLSALVNRAKIRKDLMELYIVSNPVGINGTVEDFDVFSLHHIIICSVLWNSYWAKQSIVSNFKEKVNLICLNRFETESVIHEGPYFKTPDTRNSTICLSVKLELDGTRLAKLLHKPWGSIVLFKFWIIKTAEVELFIIPTPLVGPFYSSILLSLCWIHLGYFYVWMF